jgi:hypothetical protein
MHQNDQEKGKGIRVQLINKGIRVNFNKIKLHRWMVAYTQGQAQTRARAHRYQQSCRCGISYIPLSDFRSAAFSLSPISCDKINKSHLVSCQQIKRIECKPAPHPNRTPPPQNVTPPFPPLLIFLAPQLTATCVTRCRSRGLNLLVYATSSY